jgi:predicted dithiol-disulfide oxidoreductase (DUF899 family)
MEQAKDNPHCDPVNDYNLEVAMMKADNEAFRRQYEEQRQHIAEVEKENQRIKDELAESRLKKAMTK